MKKIRIRISSSPLVITIFLRYALVITIKLSTTHKKYAFLF